MISVDWTAVLMGLAVGVVMGGLYFVGLAVGMRRALHSAKPVMLLSLSAALRMLALLGVGWIVAGQGGPWAAVGYAAAFVVSRFVATTWARSSATPRGAS
ncbi:ATP synthase subunit AtpR [Rhodobacteraceae bacterium KMM 6894]|nr:ATP synthase subunit AtpR [Rhodobacteraceae bacterium KMM 6894]